MSRHGSASVAAATSGDDEGPAGAGPSERAGLDYFEEPPPKFLKRWLNFSTRPAESRMRCLPV